MSARRELSAVRRGEILEAAAKVIVERGLADTRIADVAERAGTSAGLVIYYFGTRDRLLAEALASTEQRFYAETERQLAGVGSARERLRRLLVASCSTRDPDGESWLDDWLLWLDLWARAPRDPKVAQDREALDRRWRQTIASIVRDGQAAGEFGPIDPDDFALRLAALLDGLAIQVVLRDPEVPPERMLAICMRTCERELGFAWDGDGDGTRGRRP